MQKIQPLSKKWQKKFFFRSVLDDCVLTQQAKSFTEITLSRTASEINVFHAEFQDGWQKWREINFWQKVADYCIYPGGQKILLKSFYLSISEILKSCYCCCYY